MEGHPGELHDVPPMQAFPLLVYLKAANAEVRYSYFLVLLHTSAIATATTISTATTSSTAQGGGGSFKNRKRIGEIDCCE